MPDLGPLGRGGARRRTRRRMMARNDVENQKEQSKREYDEPVPSDNPDKLKKLARLLKDKDIITEEEFNLIFD